MNEPVEALTHKLGYTFQNPALLEEALSHRSVKGNNNERLEYLGDSILNFVIAHALFLQYPQAKEGELSRLRACLVRGETLAAVARELQLGQYIRLGVGEMRSGGHKRDSILADAVEAIIGAVYQDGGMECCQQLVLRWFESRILAVRETPAKDPKTLLQEYLQSRKHELPQYQIVSVEGQDHQQIFTVNCQVKGLKHVTTGQASSRRKAEQQAALNYLQLIQTEKS